MGSLSEYKQKRDFNNTKEPQGKNTRKVGKNLRFVVQRHHASRLHYDLRLELDGVLKSWAVPKGPSLYPKDKRLAVQVEDHPIDYGSFEGVIPKGNYGAGVVTIFDSGYYEFVDANNEKEFLQKLEAGSLKFKLRGNILKGEFALVRMNDNTGKSWLLIKHDDRYASESPFNIEDFVSKGVKEEGEIFRKKKAVNTAKAGRQDNSADEQDDLKPMTAVLSERVPEGEWIFEKKYDGFRILAAKNEGIVSLYSRNGKKMDQLFPSVVSELEKAEHAFVLDGEVVIEDKKGRPHFQLLQRGEPIPAGLRIRYYVFDLLRLNGEDTTGYPLTDRKELLSLWFRKLVDPDVVRLAEERGGMPDSVLQYAQDSGWEGIVAKDKESRYLPGKRSSSWVKVKFRQSQEAVICGYTAPQGERLYFGALILGVYENGELRYIGNCGSGFTDKSLKEIYDLMEKERVAHKPFAREVSVAKENEAVWIRPKLVCEVYYSEWTADQRLRHPVFKGLRLDKDPEGTQVEAPPPVVENERIVRYGRKKVKLTNLKKVYWPGEGYTKGHMLEYYERMSSYILPFIKNMPLSLHRFPNGIAQSGFFHKDMQTDQLPHWVTTKAMFSESSEKDIDYIICNDTATLLYVANLGSIEINPWLSTYRKPTHPQFAVLDLDPNGADFKSVVEVADTARKLLEQGGITAYLKTSGSTGLHIYIYLKQKYPFEVVRDFMEWLAQMVHEVHPDTTSLLRSPKQRQGLIYLDYLQNRRGQTVVAPYSLRPKPKATVSTPLFWEELSPDLRIDDYTLVSVPQRVERLEDPWKDIWEKAADLKQALSRF